MKKILAIVMGIALVFGVAGNAAAIMDYGTFFGSVTDDTTEWTATLDGNAFDGISSSTVENYFELSDFTAASDFSDMTFGGFAANTSGSMLENYDFWVAVTDAADVVSIGKNGFAAMTTIQNVYPNTSVVDGAVQNITSAADGLKGMIGDEMPTFAGAETSIDLGAFDAWTAGDEISLSMDIVHIYSTDWTGSWTIEDTDVDLAITRAADGSISVATVPVPGAVWLMITGILGMVGVSRRKKA